MIVFIKKLIQKVKGILRRLITTGRDQETEKMKVVHRDYSEIYRNSEKLLRDGSYRPLYGKELKMLSRRLKQFRKVHWSGSRLQKEIAGKRLKKEWNRILRNRLRVIKGSSSVQKNISSLASGSKK